MGGKTVKGADPRTMVARGLLSVAAALVLPASAALAQFSPAQIAPAQSSPVQTQPYTGVGSQFEMAYWQSVDTGSDPALYEAYLGKYPDGTFAGVARAKLAKLRGSVPPAAVPAPAPALAPEPAVLPQHGTPVAVQPGTRPNTLTNPLIEAQAGSTVVTAPAANAPPPQAPGRMIDAGLSRPVGPPTRSSGAALPPSAPQDTSDRAPYVTAAPPIDSEGSDDSMGNLSPAMQRMLEALGNDQRLGQARVPAPERPPSPLPSPLPSPPAGNPSTIPISPPGVSASAGELTGQLVPPAPPPSADAGDQRPIAVGPLPSNFALPQRPMLEGVPGYALPASFCSADVRNQFHDGPYITAVEAAKRNNDAVNAYLGALQAVYDSNQLSGSPEPQNAVAAEFRTYDPIAKAAFSTQLALVSAFKTLMAVPIIPCEAPK